MPSNNTPPQLPAKAVGKAGILYGLDTVNDNIANALRIDATGAIVTVGSTGAVPPTAATTVTTSYYIATANDSNGTDYVVDDLLRVTEVINLTSGLVLSSNWYNTSTGAAIGVPPGSEIAFRPSEALTDTQLRAAPVEVNVVNTTERAFTVDRLAGAAGTVTAGALEISIAVESGYAMVQGAYCPAGYSMTIRAEMQDTIGAVTVDATNGSVFIMEIR